MIYADMVVIDGAALFGNARGIKPHVKASLAEGVRFAHRKFQRRNFQRGAHERYGYKRRSAKYLKRKRRLGRFNPLVWTGLTRSSVVGHIRVSGTAKQAVGRSVAPWFVSMKPKKRNAPALGDEISRRSPPELEEVMAHIGNVFAARLNGDRSRKTIRV